MALVEGVQYGLSSQTHLSGKKSVIFLKLTDSALRAIEDYLRIQNKTGQQATLQFLGSEGRIHIPSSHANDGHSFDFSLSSNADIEGPQGSFECIQQCGSRSLESMGTLPFKMRIHAKDDVYETTRLRMNAVEEERKKDCAKEIKQNGADIKRKVKNKFGGGVIPPPHRREDSPNFNNHISSHNSHHSNSSKSSLQNNSTSNRDFNKLSNGTNNHSASPYNNNKNSPGSGVPSKIPNGGSSGNLDVSKRPLKERLIHLLAIKPFKKPELMARIYRDGIKERDKKLVMLILQQVSIYKDNEYNLIRGIWNDVQEDWPFYTEQERQLMKRRKPQNLTPPGSDCSVGSGTSGSSLSPRSTTSAGSGHSPINFGGSASSLMNGSERGGGYHHGSSLHRDRDHGGRGDHNMSNYSSSGSHHHVPKSNGSGGSGLLLPGTGNHYNVNATSQGVKRPGSSNGGSVLDHSVVNVDYGGNTGFGNGEIPAAKRQRVSHCGPFKKPNCSNSKEGNSSNYPPQQQSQQNGHNNGNGSSANARLDNINSVNGKLDRGERDNTRDSSSLSPAAPTASLIINSMTTHQSQHQQLHRNYSERLSPIGTANNNHNSNANSANHNSSSNSSSSLTNNQTSGQAHNSSVVTNHRSPRSVVPELINLSPSYHSSNNNGNNNSSSRERENCSQDSEFSSSSSTYHSPWTAVANGRSSNNNSNGGALNSITGPPTRSNLQVHDNNHHLSHNSQVDGIGFKIDVDVDTKLPADSDETDSVDSGNGSSSSSSSIGSGGGSRHHNINNNTTNGNSSAIVANGLGLNLPPATSVSVSSLNVNIPIVVTNGTNGCNRVSSTTNGNSFHSTTPQSSPDSQIEALQKQQLEQQQNEWKSNGSTGGGSGGYNNYNSSSNGYGGANNHHHHNNHHVNGRADRAEILSSRDKEAKYRDREQLDSNGRGDRERGDRTRESRRESRTKDRERSDRDSRGDKERIDRADRKERDREREKGKDSDDNGRQIKPASEYPSYLTKYTTIVNGEQRLRYKDDFNAEYTEYRDLHSVIDKVSKKFAHLEERLRQEERGTDGYQNVKDEIVSEYYANKKNRKYQEAKQKFTYLHEKLSHIKRLVLIYDTVHSSQSGELEDANNSDCFF